MTLLSITCLAQILFRLFVILYLCIGVSYIKYAGIQVIARLTKLYPNIADSQVTAAVRQTVVEPVGTAVREVRAIARRLGGPVLPHILWSGSNGMAYRWR